MINDESWRDDPLLFHGTFRYYHNEPRQVRGQIHMEKEKCALSDAERDVVPVTHPNSTRTYVLLKPYVLRPVYVATIGLYNEPQGSAIGEVLDSGMDSERPMRKEHVGESQLWYYPQDHLLEIWECFLEKTFCGKLLEEDTNMRALWEAVERWGRTQFPEVRSIATPFDDPMFEREEYQDFLRSLGYTPHPTARAAFWKRVKGEEHVYTDSH